MNPTPRIFIEAISPSVDGGRFPAKAVTGRPCVVEADIFRDGHDVLRAVIKWRQAGRRTFSEAPLELLVNDRWRGELPLEENTRYEYTIEAWISLYESWLVDLRKRVAVDEPVASEVREGIALLEGIAPAGRAKGAAAARPLREAARELRAWLDDGAEGAAALAIAEREDVLAAEGRLVLRIGATEFAPLLELVADRPRALYGAWYEMFPRSYSPTPGRHGTFADAARRLPALREMGFDVVYLPPIHPVGTSHRKGRNNALEAQPGDPGSPWAIGSSAGGHTAVEPQLGTLEDFDRFVAAARRLDLEVALDFAIQCSPDHPWVREHPEWFYHRPDGTIKYAENPPKKYQDIVPLNFDSPARETLWQALLEVVLFWVGHGVKIMRVDNPHTKPLPFWNWLIGQVQRRHPEVLFLSEAFTRPKIMKALAKVGFSQSYTYFTWRNEKQELTEYLTELAQTELADYFRPNFFVNTPDILHEVLQTGGRPAFMSRLVLAATLAPAYGIYSGYELCENEGVPGTEDYLNSEKYELKQRDWNQPGNIVEFVSRVNAIRHENPALQRLSNLRFLHSDSEQVLAYAKTDAESGNTLLIAVNLDAHNAHDCTVQVPLELVSAQPCSGYEVQDLLTGARYAWGASNYVRLVPGEAPAHILRVERVIP